jgi:hypothetical protein
VIETRTHRRRDARQPIPIEVEKLSNRNGHGPLNDDQAQQRHHFAGLAELAVGDSLEERINALHRQMATCPELPVNPEELLDALRSVPMHDRHRADHVKFYPLFVHALIFPDKIMRKAQIAESTRLRIFPGQQRHEIEDDVDAMVEALNARTSAGATGPTDEALDALREQAAPLLREPRILDRFVANVHQRGLVGEDRAVKVVYLAKFSLIACPTRAVSVILKGPSSAGKNAIAKSVLDFFPLTSIVYATSMSDRALIYDDEPLSY